MWEKRKILWKRWEHLDTGRMHVIWEGPAKRLFMGCFEVYEVNKQKDIDEVVLSYVEKCPSPLEHLLAFAGKRVPKKLVERLMAQETLKHL